jgi:hypothetical protein
MFVPCSIQSCLEIQNAVLKEGCDGIINVYNNLVLFSEVSIQEVEFNIHYNNN